MLASILSLLAPLAIQVFTMMIKNKNMEAQTIEAFYKFIEKLDKDSNNSVKLHDSYKEQMKVLREQRRIIKK